MTKPKTLIRVSDDARKYLKIKAAEHDVPIGDVLDHIIDVYKQIDSKRSANKRPNALQPEGE